MHSHCVRYLPANGPKCPRRASGIGSGVELKNVIVDLQPLHRYTVGQPAVEENRCRETHQRKSMLSLCVTLAGPFSILPLPAPQAETGL